MIDLSQITLRHGSHPTREDGVCAMEAVAWLAGEEHSDAPACACPVITRLIVSWNDSLQEDADRNRLLKPLLPLIVGTRASPAVEQHRSYTALDWLVRTYTPAWLDLTDALSGHAATLRALNPIVSPESATAARGHLLSAWDAAWDAGWHAARDAAWAAACVTSCDAAWAAWAAWDAGRAAAWAVWGAGRAAVMVDGAEVLAHTVASLQLSAQDLVRRMCAAGAEEATT